MKYAADVEFAPFKFVIGLDRWEVHVRYFTHEIDPCYWDEFKPVQSSELDAVEHDLKRKLPDDLRLFLTTIGAGAPPFKYGGDFYSPDEMRDACAGPILMARGLARGTTDEQLRQFYIHRGRDNPNPGEYTQQALNEHGFSAFDLLQIGTDGCCGYRQVFVGAEPRPFGYCLLHETEVYDRLPSFSEGLRMILNTHWQQRFDLIED